MPYAAKRVCSKATQYVCGHCGYTTFDSSNRRKHAKKHEMVPRTVHIGTPALPQHDRAIELERTKRFFHQHHLCPWTPRGFEYLISRLDAKDRDVDWHVQNIKPTVTMPVLLDLTWSRDTVDFAKPNPLRNVFKWNGSVFWYRSTTERAVSIDEFTLYEFPDVDETYEYLTYELFKLYRRLYEWTTTTENTRYRKPNSMMRWKTAPFRDFPTERIVGESVTSYSWWMDAIRDRIKFLIGSKDYTVRDDAYTYPVRAVIDPEASGARGVKVYACTRCEFVTPVKYRASRHETACSSRGGPDGVQGSLVEYGTVWYTQEEMIRLDPFSPREGTALDLLRERGSPRVARLEVARTGVSRLERDMLSIDSPGGVDGCIRACFDLFFGTGAIRPEFQTVMQFGPDACEVRAVGGAYRLVVVTRSSVLLRVLGDIMDILVAANPDEEVRIRRSLARLVEECRQCEASTNPHTGASTADAAYESLLSRPSVRDMARRVHDLIPTNHDLVNYLGPLPSSRVGTR